MKTIFDLTKNQVMTLITLSCNNLLNKKPEKIQVINSEQSIIINGIFPSADDYIKVSLFIDASLDLRLYAKYYTYEPCLLAVDNNSPGMFVTNQREIQINFLRWGIYPSGFNIRRKLNSCKISI